MDSIGMLHMIHSPLRRPATREDSARAMAVARALKPAIARYADTAAAVRAGYVMFAPGLKNQPVYHFTSAANGLLATMEFDPARPTSLLYKKTPSGAFKLVGAMYTMPRIATLAALDARVPLSIAEWHQHVNWCLPKPSDPPARWLERHDGRPVFGPESPIATPAACTAVGGTFQPTLFGWMVHVNVFEGDDLATIFGESHGQ